MNADKAYSMFNNFKKYVTITEQKITVKQADKDTLYRVEVPNDEDVTCMEIRIKNGYIYCSDNSEENNCIRVTTTKRKENFTIDQVCGFMLIQEFEYFNSDCVCSDKDFKIYNIDGLVKQKGINTKNEKER